MVDKVLLMCTVSKEYMKKVKIGEAILSSGGIRTLGGEILTQYRPVAFISDKLVSVGNLVSSLANNVQSGFIQHGVNKINKKADLTLERLDQIQNSLSNIKPTCGLNWANCVFGTANLAVSIAGFKMTFDKLDEISGMIKNLDSKIDAIDKRILLENFDRYAMQIKSDLDSLQEKFIEKSIFHQINSNINATKAYLQSVVDGFQQDNIDGRICCNIIYSLAVIYAKLVMEYSARYYYSHNNTLPSNYDDWIRILAIIDSDAFREKLKMVLQREYLETPHIDRMIAYQAATVGIAEQRGILEYNRLLIEAIPEERYLEMGAWIETQLRNGFYKEHGNYILVEMA